MRKFILIAALSGAAAIATGAVATPVILTFDQTNSCVSGANLNAPPGPCTFNGQNISPTYGSTAQLGVSYVNFDANGVVSQNNLNWTSDESAYATGSNGPPEDLEFIFTPLSGYEVSLSSIETWVNSGTTPVLGTFTLFDGNNQLISTTAFAASPEATGAPHTVTAFSNAYFSGPLRLHVSPTSSRSISFDNFGVDVRQIAAGVPEPATWAMMLMGFGGLGAALRSNRRRQATATV